jgi:hypothetical protein
MALLKWFDRLLERYALWRPPASADRWVRAGDRPLLRPQNLPRSRRRLSLFAVIDRAVITETAAFRQLNPRFRGVRLRQASANFQQGRWPGFPSDWIPCTVPRDRPGATLGRHSIDFSEKSHGRRCVPRGRCPTGRRVITTAFRAGWAAWRSGQTNWPMQ